MVDHYQTIRLQRVEEPKIRLRVLPRIPPLEIELQNTGTMVQWRVGTTGAWQDLIPISDLDADISIGTVTTLPAGSSATVVNSGTAQDAVLDFGIPRGQDGLIASIVAGTNITVDDTDPANPIVSAVSSAAVDSVNGATGAVVLDAGDIGVTPAGNIAASNVQAAIEELDAEKQPLDADLTALATAFARATNSGPASLALAEDTDNGSNTITLKAPASVGSNKTVTFQDASGTPALLDLEEQELTGGARVTSKSLGTITSGTVTLDPGDRPLQHYTNNGAHTLAPGSSGGSILLEIVNGASAGAISTPGFTKVNGSFTTTNAHKFHCSVVVGNAYSSLTIVSLQ